MLAGWMRMLARSLAARGRTARRRVQMCVVWRLTHNGASGCGGSLLFGGGGFADGGPLSLADHEQGEPIDVANRLIAQRGVVEPAA